MTATLYEALIGHTRGDVDRHGECHIACPECGHESSPKSPHCSFSERGFHCFVCGAGYSLTQLAKRVNLETGDYRPVRAAQRPKPPAKSRDPYWMTFDGSQAVIRSFESHPRRFELWDAYKRLPYELIREKRLGVGKLPASRCSHDRLIVPVFDGTMLVGIRGRAIDCDCGKWLCSGGWSLDLVPLYNQESLRPGAVVWIVENPVDALMVTEQTPYVGVATYGVTYWREAWTAALQEARPELVIVAYDNDLPGNGGGPRRREFERVWLADPRHRAVPKANGVRLVNDLLRAGLTAALYDWGRAENKTDIGSLLAAA
jgi:hypothetical protein